MTFKSIMEEAGLPEGWIEIVNTANSDVATKLVTDSRVRFFSFIGSGGVGWRLRSQLAPGVRCALEHGGVAPVIVASDADVEKAVTALTKGGFYHAGQVCVSVQRIFAHESVYDELVEGITANAKTLTVGDPTSDKTEVGPIISHREADRVGQWVDEAVSGGATLAVGGVRLSDSTYSPTVLLNPPADSKVSRQEIFGPVVAIFKVSSVEQGISLANNIEFAFQSSIFTNDIDQAFFAFKRLNASAVMVNDHTAFRTDWMPFAGLGPSGLGIGGMPHTMHEMQYEKMMVVNTPALATL
ncbi:MAG: hypothetical protein CMM47_09615 [Rhodospirillaceae bacterium]|nr:hypothetical protein [Rhodospirillaceae bacterium]